MSEEAEVVDNAPPADVVPPEDASGEPADAPAEDAPAEDAPAPDPAPAPEQAVDGESAPQSAPEAPSDPVAESQVEPAPATDEAPATDAAPEQEPPAKESIEPAAIEGTLHVAARAGSVDSTKMLLQNGADPMALDAEGRTALSIAQELGFEEVARLLSEASPQEEPAKAPSKTEQKSEPESSPTKQDVEKEAAPQTPQKNLPVLTDATKSPPQGSPIGASTPSPAASPSMKSRGAESPAGRSLRADVERILGGFEEEDGSAGEEGSMSRKKPPLMATTEGIVKGPTYMVAHSKWKASPKWSMVPRGPSFMNRASSAPAPGTYDLPSTEKTKFKTGPRFGFGIGSRFGLDDVPVGKHMPGPATYKPKDPCLTPGTKVGFGTSVRAGMGISGGFIPGPGAYEQKSSIGQGMMFTAKGKHSSAYMKRSASAPGPGAYTPSIRFAYKEAPKCGFGTSSRDSEHARAARTQGNPGPGAYEMQYHAGIGRDAVKYSATSRRRVHDLNSYLTPGPGTYNAHVTSFGY